MALNPRFFQFLLTNHFPKMVHILSKLMCDINFFNLITGKRSMQIENPFVHVFFELFAVNEIFILVTASEIEVRFTHRFSLFFLESPFLNKASEKIKQYDFTEFFAKNVSPIPKWSKTSTRSNHNDGRLDPIW